MHLFAGAGGGLLADLLLGHQPICAVEIDPYCNKVLHARQKDGYLPWFPIFGDVQEFDGKPWRGLVDVVCGGFPCQDVSAAGKGAGISGTRSGLWGEAARIIHEVGPRFAFVENSPLLTSRGLGVVLGDLAEMGYDARWGVFSAAQVGAEHIRERIFILANSNRNRLEGVRCLHNESEGHERKEAIRCGNRLMPEVGTTNLAIPKGLPDPPPNPRMADAVAYRMDRLKSSGNGQVPRVVRLAWNTLIGRITPPPDCAQTQPI